MSIELETTELKSIEQDVYTVEEYLALEEIATSKSEYVAGVIYPMVGATNEHNDVAGNVFGSLWAQLEGKPCKVCTSDTKVRIQLPDRTIFYYPDALVTCKPNPGNITYQDHPKLILEVLSPSTRRFDQNEKREAYFQIDSLSYYLIVNPTQVRVDMYHREGGAFLKTTFSKLEDHISLPEIGCELLLKKMYANTDVVAS